MSSHSWLLQLCQPPPLSTAAAAAAAVVVVYTALLAEAAVDRSSRSLARWLVTCCVVVNVKCPSHRAVLRGCHTRPSQVTPNRYTSRHTCLPARHTCSSHVTSSRHTPITPGRHTRTLHLTVTLGSLSWPSYVTPGRRVCESVA